MTTTLTFTDDDGPDAVSDALHGWQYRAAYERVQETLRSMVKYGTGGQYDQNTLERIKDLMHDEHPGA